MKAADMASDDGVMGLRTRLSEDRIRVISWWPRSGGRGRLTEATHKGTIGEVTS